MKVTREDREAAAAALMNPVLVPRSTVDAWVDTGFEDFNGWEAMAREYRDVAAAIAKARAEGAADEAKAIAWYLRELSDGLCTAESKLALRVAANDIERGEHRKVAL